MSPTIHLVQATMSPTLSHMVMIALLTFTAHCSPGRLNPSTNDCRPGGLKPTVTVGNSSHLLVGWEGVFLGCAGQSVRVALDGLVTSVKVEEKSTARLADPCLKHTVVVKLPYEDSKYEHKLVYNEHTFKQHSHRRYGGLLGDVRQSICRKTQVDNYTTGSLDIPAKISRCILSGNEVKIEKATHSWEPNYFQLEIIDPDDANDSVHIDVEMNNARPNACACTPSGRPPKVGFANSSHLWINWNGSFTQCNKETIDFVTVTLDNRNTTTKFDTVNHYLSYDPCVNHTILVTLNLKDESIDNTVATQFSTEMIHVKNNTTLCHSQPVVPVVALVLMATLLIILIVSIAIFCIRRNSLSRKHSQSQSSISSGSPDPLRPGQYTPIIVHHVPDSSYLPNYQQGWSQSSSYSHIFCLSTRSDE